METRICKTCDLEKMLSDFPREMRKDRWYYLPHCKLCIEIKKGPGKKIYRKKNSGILKIKKKEYYENNKSIPKFQEARRKVRENGRNKRRENEKLKRINDPIFKLRDNVRVMIRLMIFNNYGSKNGSSISEYLPFTITELRKHLEQQFEPWMTWENYGKYKAKTWDDNDPSTWTWQIDHIIPQSDLPYSSMEDDNFKKCWSLENLRPLSSKINSIEGAKRIRHKVGI
jgi:hypothetical protein